VERARLIARRSVLQALRWSDCVMGMEH